MTHDVFLRTVSQFFSTPAGWLLAGAVVFALIVGAVLQGREDLPYDAAGPLLTPAERAFFVVLRQAIGSEYQLFVKVRLGDILQVERGVSGKRRFRAFGRISSKHADFVACDPRTFAVVGVIELDDKSHRQPHRRERDRFFDAALGVASIPVLRVTVQRSYSAEELRTRARAVFGAERKSFLS